MRDDPLPKDAGLRFEAFLARRAAREPVSHIIGRREFYGRDFEVSAAVLDPRPETEGIVEWVLAGSAPDRLLDLGTGSGALLVSLLADCPGAVGLGTDVSEEALAVAASNARRHGVSDRVRFALSDWFGAVTGRFDVIDFATRPIFRTRRATRLRRRFGIGNPNLRFLAGRTGWTRIAYWRRAWWITSNPAAARSSNSGSGKATMCRLCSPRPDGEMPNSSRTSPGERVSLPSGKRASFICHSISIVMRDSCCFPPARPI